MKRIFPRHFSVPLLAAAFGLVGMTSFPGRAVGQDPDIRQAVARIAYLSGDVSYSRGDDPDNWQSPSINVPFTLGDRIYSPENGRVELQIRGGEFVRLAPRTEFAALNLTDDVKQFSLTAGTASIQLRRLDEDETFEVDTPNVAVTFERPGGYRIDVDSNGNTRVSCFQGEATVAAAGGEVPLRPGEQMWIDGIDDPEYEIGRLDEQDSWDRWVASRESRASRVTSYGYANFNIEGLGDLEEYGQWVDVPVYGRCWTPSRVEAGWQPYRWGRWIWEDPWGWTWVGDEPWGWAPYHYGRWVVEASRWYWVPVGPSVAVEYSPALVAFVGGGPGWSLSLDLGGDGYVGWFPLGPRDPFFPWWGSRARFRSDAADTRFANRSYVTVVRENTFVSGGIVSAGAIRDPQIIRRIASAPVLRGPVPVVPTAGSLRVSARPEVAAFRPPASIAARPVVTRAAPPPAPARFQEKLGVIRESRGAPVSASAAARISIAERGGARAVVPVRPVVAEQGRMAFQPRNAQSSTPRAAPVMERRGRPLATMQRPIVSAPAGAAAAEAPARIAPGAVVPPRNAPAPRPPEGGVPRTFERRISPPPPAPPGRPEEGWRTRQSAPPPDQPPPPPRQEFRRIESAPPPPSALPGAQSPPPPPREPRFQRPPASSAPEAAPGERGAGARPAPSGRAVASPNLRRAPAPRGKNVAGKGKKAPDKEKGKKPPPPPPPPPSPQGLP